MVSPAFIGAISVQSGGAAPGTGYADAVSADNPRLWLRMQETAVNGSAAVNSGSYTTGSGSIYALSTTDRPLQPGAGIVNGDSKSLRTTTYLSQINVGDSGSSNITASGSYTVEAWFRTSASGDYQMLFSADKSVRVFQLRINPSGFLEIVHINGAVSTLASPTAVNDNAIHCAQATLGAGGVLTLYLDGVAVATTTNASMSGNVKNDADVAGYGSNSNYQFKGWIAEVAVYDGALSATRLKAHYDAGK